MSSFTTPTYTDRTHPIYAALPIADALDRLDRRHGPSDYSDDAIRAEALLIDAGEAADGLSGDGFRHDLIYYVQTGERDQDEALFESSGARGFYDYNGEPCREAHTHGRWLAAEWIKQVTAVLQRHGYRIDGCEIVPALMAEAA